MIIRLIVIDPRPAAGRSDILAYQVPENSRELKLLTDLFTEKGLEWDIVAPTRKPKEVKQ